MNGTLASLWRRLTIGGATLGAVLLAATLLPAQSPKLNVLMIAIDDLRPELGCYGNRIIDTPSFDKLASWGVRFERAYCQFPLCNPSRTSLFTGRHPNTTGVYDNRTWFADLHPDYVSLPRYFRQHGYVTARTGKIFHGGIDDTDAWTIGGEKRVDQKTRPGQDPMLSDRIVRLEGDGESHGDYRSATRAIALLEELKDQTFFLAVGFSKPHSPPTAPAKLFDLYDPARMPLPPDFAPRPTVPPGFPEAAVPPRNGDLFIGRDASPEAAREVIRAYYASTTFVDRQIGRLLAALDKLQLHERTVIVLFGDHGYHLGEKGKWSKHNSVFEVACRVPLLVCLPGGAAGKVSPRPAQLVDIYPTLCDACGLPLPAGLEGHSLVPLAKDPEAPWPHAAYTVCRNGAAFGQSVRNERWRYTEFTGGSGGALLFDHQTDPHERTNLAQDPGHRAVVEEMKRLLAKLPPRSGAN
jgi:arylsulfatase A-like enzyme